MFIYVGITFLPSIHMLFLSYIYMYICTCNPCSCTHYNIHVYTVHITCMCSVMYMYVFLVSYAVLGTAKNFLINSPPLLPYSRVNAGEEHCPKIQSQNLRSC